MGKIQAVVMGRNYMSLLSMIRAAGEAGCEVTVVRSVSKKRDKIEKWKYIEALSKYVKHYEQVVEPDREGLVSLLLRLFRGEKDVILLPTDDYTVSTIDLYMERLRDNFIFSNINYRPGAIVEMMDKNFQKSLARKVGLKVADGWIVQVENGKYTLPEGIRYPVFPKPQTSFYGNKKCMKKCKNREELEKVLDEVASERNCPMLIEQFIDIDNEYCVQGLSTPNEAVLPIIVKKLDVGHGAHQGVTMIGEIHPLEQYADIQNKLKEYLGLIGFVGMVDFDLNESNGDFYFSEMNLRPGATGYAALCAGVNIPEMLIYTLLGKDISNKNKKVEKVFTCISEKVNIEDYRAGYLTYEEYRNNYKRVDYRFLKSMRDPKPYVCFKLKEIKEMLRKKTQ